MSKFKYRERSAETVSSRAKQSGGNFDSYMNPQLNFAKIKGGKNNLRILPPTWDVDGPFGDNWGIEVYVHRDIGPDNGVYLCLDQMRKKYGTKVVSNKLGDCPLCAARNEVDADDEAATKALKPQKQILTYVIDRGNEKEGPMVWRMGWMLERDIQIRSQDKTGAVIPLDHPDRGYDISFMREGEGIKTKYVGVDIDRDESPLSENQKRADKWLSFIEENPLPDQLVLYDAAYLEKVYMGKASKKGGNADDEEDDDRPLRSKRRSQDEDEDDAPPSRKSRKPVEDDEEEATPPPRKRGRSQPDDEEEDDRPHRRGQRDDDDDELPSDTEMKRNSKRYQKDEDEDDAPPPRKSSRKPAVDEDEEEDDSPPKRASSKSSSRKVDDEDEEEEDAPPPRRQSAKGKSRTAPDEEDEEDEDRPTQRTKSSKGTAARPRDEEDDEDMDEDDAPPSKSAAKAKASLDRLRSRSR